MKNLSIIYDDYIDIWWGHVYRRIDLNPNNYITIVPNSNPLHPNGSSVSYDYSALNLTGKIVDLRTNI